MIVEAGIVCIMSQYGPLCMPNCDDVSTDERAAMICELPVHPTKRTPGGSFEKQMHDLLNEFLNRKKEEGDPV